MINLRYHIVSITAVFLALGIGLAFGSAFIDRATVGQLERNLRDIERQNDSLEQRNAELSSEVSAAERLEQGLRDEALGELLEGRLRDVPVLVLASDGLDGEVVEAVEAALLAAGAQLAGVVRVTERFALDDDGELDDLRGVLDLPDAGESQLRIAATRRVRTVLAAAATPAAELPPDIDVAFPVPMPPLLGDLLDAGFLELDPADPAAEDFALVPASDLRVLALSGPGASVADDDFLAPMLASLVAPDPTAPDGPPPVVVVAQPTVGGDGEDEGDGDGENGADFVGPLRDDDVLRARVSTIDHVDAFAGLAAAVLALQHGADGQVGHYGVGDGAESLLPPLPALDGSGG